MELLCKTDGWTATSTSFLMLVLHRSLSTTLQVMASEADQFLKRVYRDIWKEFGLNFTLYTMSNYCCSIQLAGDEDCLINTAISLKYGLWSCDRSGRI